MKLKLTHNKNVVKSEELDKWREDSILMNELPKSNATKEQIEKVKTILEESEIDESK